ncbi:MAG: hypothetical protein AB8B49_11165 [Nitratireductor sp.]
MFDSTSIIWYAAICGTLSAIAPSLGGTLSRIGIGALIGILAASLLPFLKGMIGY